MIIYQIVYYLHLVIFSVPLLYHFVVRGGLNSNAFEDHQGRRLGELH
jgi:hypothetical protein